MQINRVDDIVQIEESFKLLRGLENYYPDFNAWFAKAYLKTPLSSQDIILTARDHGFVVGVVLGKRTTEETKLRCVRIHPALKNTGLGLRLIEKSFEYLESDKPHVTVSEEMIHEYSRAFVNRYGFSLDQVEKGLYRPRKLEYLFNQ